MKKTTADQDSIIKTKLKQLRQTIHKRVKSSGLAWEAPSEQYSDEESISLMFKKLFDDFAIKKAQADILMSTNKWNEEQMLVSYRTLSQFLDSMSTFAKYFCSDSQQYSQDMNKSFRKMYEYISCLSMTIHTFKSQTPDFVKQKDEYMVSLMSSISSVSSKLKNTQSSSTLNNNSRQPDKTEAKTNNNTSSLSTLNISNSALSAELEALEKETTAQLQSQISQLEEILRENNDQFAEEIQRYNQVLYEQQQELRRADKEMSAMVARIEELEGLTIRMREEKFRDELMIENMTKKLRSFEKDRGYLSPRTNTNRPLSPNISFVRSGSPPGMQYMGFYPKLRND